MICMTAAGRDREGGSAAAAVAATATAAFVGS